MNAFKMMANPALQRALQESMSETGAKYTLIGINEGIAVLTSILSSGTTSLFCFGDVNKDNQLLMCGRRWFTIMKKVVPMVSVKFLANNLS